MAYEMIYGLQVNDEAAYQRYRDDMMPLLTAAGGGFRYDMRVSEVLKAEGDVAINRLFAIFFPSQEAATTFFADQAYKNVRAEHFEGSVASSTKIAAYERE